MIKLYISKKWFLIFKKRVLLSTLKLKNWNNFIKNNCNMKKLYVLFYPLENDDPLWWWGSIVTLRIVINPWVWDWQPIVRHFLFPDPDRLTRYQRSIWILHCQKIEIAYRDYSWWQNLWSLFGLDFEKHELLRIDKFQFFLIIRFSVWEKTNFSVSFLTFVSGR